MLNQFFFPFSFCLLPFAFYGFSCSDIIETYGIAVRVLGDLSLLSPELQATLQRAVEFSRKNQRFFFFLLSLFTAPHCRVFRAIFNICFAYTSHQEFYRSAGEIREGVSRQEILPV